MSSLRSLGDRVLLVILDGVGIGPNTCKNAVENASTPRLDHLFETYPFTTLESGGRSVGLPDGVSGNSEVGHMNLGAGRPIRQDLVRINEAIEKKTLKDRSGWKELLSYARSHGGRLHLMGLVSDGGVHSHIDHLKELLRMISAEEISLYLHAFMDGRDTGQRDGPRYIQDILGLDLCTLASMQGRSFAMDRDCRWEKIETAYKTMTGQGSLCPLGPLDYLESQYEQGLYDEFVEPTLFHQEGAVAQGDAVFFINFRPDRARQITLAFCDPGFCEFPRSTTPGYFLCMAPYVDEEVELPVLFEREKVSQTLCEHLSFLGLRQFKIAETEKYAHVTYFLNGGEKTPFAREDRVLVPSPRDVATYDLKPEMSAEEVTDRLLSALGEEKEGGYRFLCANYANGDMVGHTGNYEAAVKAMEYVDHCVGRLMDRCLEEGIVLMVTADHGNCDQMTYEDGRPHTSHSKAPVPFVICHPALRSAKLEVAGPHLSLQDVAPTVLSCLGIDNPKAFVGRPIFY
ncbi:MAG: 2,3-bisphosphoglycerate-independent phosphoglycerate mutase [Bacteriovoracales bacterium]|nr:2,3-bisphosphoglycerate-independent phosphoglycerate mutase [Bacteriovoracales bacterium]